MKVADASPIPTMIYNFPVVTAGINLDSDIIAALGEHPNIVGTKLSCADVGKLNRLTSKLSPSKFAAFPGSSSVFLQGLVVGSAGIIGALPNVVPRAHVKLYKLWKAGNLAEAQKLQAQLANADWELQKLGSIAGIKAVVSKHFGYGNTRVRGPSTPRDLDVESSDATAHLRSLIELENSLPKAEKESQQKEQEKDSQQEESQQTEKEKDSQEESQKGSQKEKESQ